MHFYITNSAIPELKPLPASVRQLIVQRALVRLRARSRWVCWLLSLLCCIGGVSGMLIGSILLRPLRPTLFAIGLGRMSQDALFGYACLAIGGLPAGFAGSLVLRSRLRPHIQKLINEGLIESLAASSIR